jgi:hypothetical protein
MFLKNEERRATFVSADTRSNWLGPTKNRRACGVAGVKKVDFSAKGA